MRVDPEDRCVGGVDQLGVLPLLGQSCRNVLTDSHHANHVALFITSARSVQKHLNTISTLRDEGELEVCRLVSREGLIEHSLDRSLEIVGDEILDQRSSHYFHGAVTNQSACTFVPDVDTAERINSKDGGIGRINETSIFTLLGETASDVLADAHHADNVPLLVTSGGGVEQDIEADASLGHERELKVGGLLSVKSLIQDSLDRSLELVGYELLNQNLPNHFIGAVAHQSHCTLIPHVYRSMRVDPEDRRVRRVNQLGVLPLLRQSRRDVLADPHHANHVPLLVASACGVKQHLHAMATLRDEGEFEVVRLIPREGLIEHGLDGRLEVVGDEILHEGPSHDLLGAIPDQTARTLVPNVDTAERIDTEDGGVGRVDEPGVLPLLRQPAGDVLADAHDPDDVPLLVAPCRGVEEYLEACAGLRH